MHGHILAKCGDVLWEAALRLGAQAVDPELQRRLRRREEPLPLSRVSLCVSAIGERLRGVKNLVGIRVADSAKDARIGQRSLERAVFGRQCALERFEIAAKDVDAAGIERRQSASSPSTMCSEARRLVPASVSTSEPSWKVESG